MSHQTYSTRAFSRLQPYSAPQTQNPPNFSEKAVEAIDTSPTRRVH